MKKILYNYIIHLLKVLSRPQKRYFLVYITGLIRIIKFRSIREIAHQFGEENTDGVHHFIKNSATKTDALEEANQEFIADALKDQNITLIIDDTACEREGKKIEGIGIHHGPKGLIKGLCAVTTIVKSCQQQWVWTIRTYCPKRSIEKELFRSKIQIALEIMEQVKNLFQQRVTILIDSWYSCAPVLNRIITAGWIFIAAIKCNRIILVKGRKTSVRHLAKGPRKYQTIRLSKKRVFEVAHKVVHIPKVGDVILFICKHNHAIRFFISNDLTLTNRKMVETYNERFDIEFFHKDIKQHLGFGELFVRSRHSVQKHWIIVAIAYNIVTLSSKKSFRSFRQKITHLRDTFSTDYFMQLAAA